MKNIIGFFTFLLILAITAVTLQNCGKSEISQETRESPSMEFELNKLHELLKNVRNSSEVFNRAGDCSNQNNSQDFQGVSHNEVLQDLYDGNYISDSIPHLIHGFETVSGFDVMVSDSFVVDLFHHIDSLVHDDRGRYSDEFLNSLSSELPSYELSIMNEFFEEVDGCDTLAVRVSMSIATEDFIKTSVALSTESKTRMLTSLSIYRHSTCFWDDIIDNNNSLKQSDIFDAIGVYIAQNCDCEPGMIEDGADINYFSALYSAMMSALTGFR